MIRKIYKDAYDARYKPCEHAAAHLAGLQAVAAPSSPGVPDSVRTASQAQHFGIIDPDYARVFTIARCLAWQEGYALVMHGSFTRDLDLLAVPWRDDACEPQHLMRRIAEAADLKPTTDEPGQKPHGRLAWTLLFRGFGDPRFVDLSVMQRSISTPPGGQQHAPGKWVCNGDPAPSSPGVPDDLREAVLKLDAIRAEEAKSFQNGGGMRLHRIIPQQAHAETLALEYVRTVLAHPGGQSTRQEARTALIAELVEAAIEYDREDNRCETPDEVRRDAAKARMEAAEKALTDAG